MIVTTATAADALIMAGGTTRKDSDGLIDTYRLAIDGYELTATCGQGQNRLIREIDLRELFDKRRNLHPILRLYQQVTAIRLMERDGATVNLTMVAKGKLYRVRVKRQTENGTYNIHLDSPHAFPVMVMFDNYRLRFPLDD